MSFEEIVTAAETLNPDRLRDAIRDSCIDRRKIGDPHLSPAGYWASKGKFALSDFLISGGANINLAAYGAMLGGHEKYALQLVALGANHYWLLLAAIESGNDDYANPLLEEDVPSHILNKVIESAAFYAVKFPEKLAYVKNLLDKSGANIIYAIEGAARGEYPACVDIVKALLDLNQNNPDIKPDKLIIAAAKGAAQAGNLEYSNELLLQINDEKIYKQAYYKLAYSAALGGDKEYVKRLKYWRIKDRGNTYHFERRLMWGAAQCGNREDAEKMRNDNEFPINETIQYAAKGGHFYFVKNLFKDLDVREIEITQFCYKALIDGALESGHLLLSHPKNLIWFLSFFDAYTISNLREIILAKNPENPILIDLDVVNKSIELSTYRDQGYGYSMDKFDKFLPIVTAPQRIGPFFLLLHIAKGSQQTPKSPDFPIEIWLLILNFILPVKVENVDEIKYLGNAILKKEFKPLWKQKSFFENMGSIFTGVASSLGNFLKNNNDSQKPNNTQLTYPNNSADPDDAKESVEKKDGCRIQ